MVSDREFSVPIIKTTTEQCLRLLDSTPIKTTGDVMELVEENLSLSKILIILDNDTKYLLEYKTDEVTCVAHYKDKYLFSASRNRYELDDKTFEIEVHIPDHIQHNRDKLADEALAEMKKILAINGVLQYSMLHPEKVFKVGRKGKRVLNKSPKHGNDEPLYQRIQALRSTVQETRSTGKGTPHKHEYDVRGHYRHYKNGKVVFVKPHTCCVGRGAKNIHEYEVQ